MNNTTLADTRVGWVSGPNGRGTASLLWSCLFTIFICTWTAFHVNVPARGTSKMGMFWKKFKYMAIGILVPEFITMVAAVDRSTAVSFRNDANDILRLRQLPPISLSYSFFTLMGGFELAANDHGSIRLTHETYLSALREGIIERPKHDDEDIKDKSKADSLLKAIAMVQIGWLIAQLIGRGIQHLTITTVELFTAAIVGCTLLNYILWWSKPLDVTRPIVLRVDMPLAELRKKYPNSPRRIKTTDNGHEKTSDFLQAFLSVCILGLCHLCAWNFPFPSEVERTIWRAASVAVVVLPMTSIAWIQLVDFNSQRWAYLLFMSSSFMYIVVRTYLFVEIFVGLRSVPADVYQDVNWNRFVPHV